MKRANDPYIIYIKYLLLDIILLIRNIVSYYAVTGFQCQEALHLAIELSLKP